MRCRANLLIYPNVSICFWNFCFLRKRFLYLEVINGVLNSIVYDHEVSSIYKNLVGVRHLRKTIRDLWSNLVIVTKCAKTTWSNFKPKLFTVQDHFYIVQSPFVHVQNRHANVQGTFVHVQNLHANVQCPFAHGPKPSCKRSMPFCTRRKTVLQAFNVRLFTLQTLSKELQRLIVHGARLLCQCSMPDSWYR